MTLDNGQAWLANAVQETVGTGASLAWELLESDLLQLLSQQVRKAHPEVQLADTLFAAGGSTAALKEARETAMALVGRHEAQAELRRVSLVRTAIASMQVRRVGATARWAPHWQHATSLAKRTTLACVRYAKRCAACERAASACCARISLNPELPWPSRMRRLPPKPRRQLQPAVL
jgi:hypothetical protein